MGNDNYVDHGHIAGQHYNGNMNDGADVHRSETDKWVVLI